MSIQVLPKACVRLIGASQVLTDPTSIVKELIDNSLDANATSIAVEISCDTLSLIQVRDNGVGVAPEDRLLLCHRYCTSKIRSLSDLRSIGGSSLGFRGDALASAAELSAGLSITTRVEGEDVATTLKVGRNGEVEKQDHASQPVGTTVRLNDLFNYLPVRKQTAAKSSAKCLTKIKNVLQCYAFARPTTRFSFRVLKEKSGNGNWTYVPTVGAAMLDTALKIVGKECALQCSWSAMKVDGYDIAAFLPNVDADPSKIGGIGPFLSIDGRPVATRAGTLRQISSTFRERLKNSNRRCSDVKEPFAWIRVKCPLESYDANIEPAKDDLLFEDGDKLLEAFGKLLDLAYPQLEVEAQSAIRVYNISDDEGGIDIERPRSRRQHFEHATIRGRAAGMTDAVTVDENCAVASAANHASNPWVVTKMNPSTTPRRRTSMRNGQTLTPLDDCTTSESNSQSVTEHRELPAFPPWTLPSPEPSPNGNNEQHLSSRYVRHGSQLLDAQPDGLASVIRTSEAMNHQHGGRIAKPLKIPNTRWTGWQRPGNDFVTAAHLPTVLSSTGSSSEPSIQGPRRSARQKKASGQDENNVNLPPVQDESRIWFPQSNITSSNMPKRGTKRQHHVMDIRDAFRSSPEKFSRPKQAKLNPPSPLTLQHSITGNGLNLPYQLGVPQRQRAEYGRTTIPGSIISVAVAPNAPQNAEKTSRPQRELVDITCRHPLVEGALSGSTTASGTPGQSDSKCRSSLKRTATSRLPLECVPNAEEIQNLVQPVRTYTDAVKNLAERLQYLQYDLFPDPWRSAGWEIWSEAATVTDECVPSVRLDADENPTNEPSPPPPKGGFTETAFQDRSLDIDDVQNWRDSVTEYLVGREGLCFSVEDKESLGMQIQAAIRGVMADELGRHPVE